MIKILSTIIFLYVQFLFAQVKVDPHINLTNEQLNKQHYFSEASKESEKYRFDPEIIKVENAVQLLSCNPRDLNDCKISLEKIKIANELMKSSRIEFKAKKIDELYSKGGSNIRYYPTVIDYQKKIDDCERTVKAKMNELNNKSKELQSKKENHRIKMKELDLQLQKEVTESNKVEDLSKNLAKDKNIDDFLSEKKILKKNKSKVDFLANNENDSADFLAENKKEQIKVNYNIKIKNEMQGVVDENDNILIPFGNYEIVEYKNGIAKIKKTIEKVYVKLDSNVKEDGNIVVYETGFIDNTGNYLDGNKLIIEDECYSRMFGLLVKREGDDRSWEEIRESVAKARAIEFTRVEKIIKRVKNNLITKYNIK